MEVSIFEFDEYQAEDAVEKSLVDGHTRLLALIDGKSDAEASADLLRVTANGGEQHAQIMDGLFCAVLNAAPTDGFGLSESFFRLMTMTVRDNFEHIRTRLLYCSGRLYTQLRNPQQFLSLVDQLIEKHVPKMDTVILELLKNVRTGSEPSRSALMLNERLLDMLIRHRSTWTLHYHGIIATSVYVFLRTLLDHAKQPRLRQREAQYVQSMLREKFRECSFIGRDLLRLLYDVIAAGIPELDIFAKQVFSGTAISGFEGVEKLISTPTPHHFLQCHIPHEMDMDLRFILGQVKWGSNDDTYLKWFVDIHFGDGGISPYFLADVVRFIVGGIHPTAEMIVAGVVPRYATIGKLLKTSKDREIASPVKLALFYDWLGFDPAKDSVMVLEPGILLMERSADKYMAITEILLDYLDKISREFNAPTSSFIRHRIFIAAHSCLSKGVITSFEKLLQTNDRGKQVVTSLFSTSQPAQSELGHVEPPLITESTVQMELTANAQSERPVSNDMTADSLWMFGDLLKDLSVAEDEPKASTVLKDILDIAVKMSVDPNVLAPRIAMRMNIQPNGDVGQLLCDVLCNASTGLEQTEAYSRRLIRALVAQFSSDDDPISWRILRHGFNATLVDTIDPFALYRHTLEGVVNQADHEQLARDMTKLEEADTDALFTMIPVLFEGLPDLCQGNMAIIRQLASIIDASNMYRMVWQLSARAFRLFGPNFDAASIVSTVDWESFEQSNVWILFATESAVNHDDRSGACTRTLVQDLLQLVNVNVHPELAMGLLSLLKLDSSAHLDHNLIRALLRSNVVVDRTEGEYNPNTTTCPFFIAVFQCWLAAGDRRNGSVDSREGFLRALEHVVREEGDDSERALDAVYEQLCIWRKAVPATFHDVILDRMMARLESGGGSGDTGANQ